MPMPLWPFKRTGSETLSLPQLRDRLIQAAASGSRQSLLDLCKLHKAQVAANVDFMAKAPDDIRADPDAMEHYIQCLIAVAQRLARECSIGLPAIPPRPLQAAQGSGGRQRRFHGQGPR